MAFEVVEADVIDWLRAQPAEPAMNVLGALRNVVTLLQEDPRAYRRFGVWWWAVKALLRRAGYGPEQLYLLGEYRNHEQAALVPRAALEETLAAAFEEFAQNSAFGRPGGEVETPDGEVVQVMDLDAAQ